jgi:hypothetical protein
MKRALKAASCYYPIEGGTAADMRAKAKLNFEADGKSWELNGASSTRALDQRVSRAASKCVSMIINNVSPEIQKELHLLGDDAEKVWKFVSEIGGNTKTAVIDDMRDQVNRNTYHQATSDMAYATLKRDLWVNLESTKSGKISEQDFMTNLLRQLPELKYSMIREKYLLKCDSDEAFTWEDLIKDIEAKGKQQATTTNHKTGAPKQGKQEETTDTALVALSKQVRRLEANQATGRRGGQGKRREGKKGDKGECYNFEDDGTCRFGKDCFFLHNGRTPTDKDLKSRQRQKKEQQNNNPNPRFRQRQGKRNRRAREAEPESEEEEDERAHHVREKRRRKRRRTDKKQEKQDQFGLYVDEESNITTADVVRPRSFFKLLMPMVSNIFMLMFVFCCIFMNAKPAAEWVSQNVVSWTPELNQENAFAVTTTALIMTGYNYHTNISETILASIHGASNNSAVSDSGATCHLIGSLNLFKRMTNVTTTSETIWMNNFKSSITHRGDLQVKLRVNGSAKYETVTLYNVAYVPTSRHNLFSITAWLDSCYTHHDMESKVVYTRKKATITLPHGGEYTGKRTSNLYMIEWPEEEETNLHKNHSSDKASKKRTSKLVNESDSCSTTDSSSSETSDAFSECETSDLDTSYVASDSEVNDKPSQARIRGRRGRKKKSKALN